MDYWIRDKKGFKTQVTDVKSITYVDVTVYDTSNYRDDPQGMIQTPTDITANQLAETYIGSSTFVSAGVADPVSHVAPRNESKKWTQIRFWSGKSQSGITCGITTSSTTMTVPSSYYMAAGQLVSGTGIVTGTLIASITNANTIVLSQAATATNASASITFDDGELLHFIWATEFRQTSNNTFTRI